jgi:transaldolase
VSKLDQLRAMTTVVADTGDIDAIRALKPQDCTTNPTLVLKAIALPSHERILADALAWGRAQAGDRAEVAKAVAGRLALDIGAEIAGIVPGRVSTEVDADLSFDTEGTVAKAHEIIADYEARGVPREKILIKIASTWEGVRAAAILEGDGISCNMTLLFNLAQAAACFDAGATLISPFVGRILDWHVKARGAPIPIEEDPGVGSVRRIYAYAKRHGYPTIVMGASFRSAAQIEALAGCDALTIAPNLMQELAADTGELPRRLSADALAASGEAHMTLDEKAFRWALNEDAMATEKLAEGIRLFAGDLARLRAEVAKRLAA